MNLNITRSKLISLYLLLATIFMSLWLIPWNIEDETLPKNRIRRIPLTDTTLQKVPDPVRIVEIVDTNKSPTKPSFTREDLETFLRLNGRTIRNLCFTASMQRPIDKEWLAEAKLLLEELKNKDPSTAKKMRKYVTALDIQNAAEDSLRGRNKEAFADAIKAALIEDPHNSYYARMQIHDLIWKKDYESIPSVLAAISQDELQNGNLTHEFRESYEIFLTQLGWSKKQILEQIPLSGFSDRLTAFDPSSTLGMMAFEFEKRSLAGESTPLPSQTMLGLIDLVMGDPAGRDDIVSLKSQLGTEERLLTQLVKSDPSVQGELNNIKAQNEETATLRRFYANALANATDEQINLFFEYREKVGELPALLTWYEKSKAINGWK